MVGFDPLELEPRRFYNWAVAWFRERMSSKDFQSFEMKLNRPAPGQKPDAKSQAKMVATNEAALALFGGGRASQGMKMGKTD